MNRFFLVIFLLLLSACSNATILNNGAETVPAQKVTIVEDGTTRQVESSAGTVRNLLLNAGITLRAADLVQPALDTPLAGIETVSITHAKYVDAKIDGNTYHGYSIQTQPNAILNELGFRAGAMDILTVSDDGSIHLKRVREKVELETVFLPYQTEYEKSDSLAAGQSVVLKQGQPGVEIGQRRIAKMGAETIRTIETPRRKVSEPLTQLLQISTLTGVGTVKVGNRAYTYWKSLEMYTTSYSPCGQGTGKCSTGTASGIPLDYGVVAVKPNVFNALAGTLVYIPGYGIGTIGDVGGGFPDGRPWIDLGYSDANYVGWSGYHTVYFLGETPAYDPFGY